ncbi:MAG: aldo/keto reductase [Nitrososphaeria archaeon]|jgi:aryl-alcohol dehydrogenase (NADP+)
MKYVRLGWSGLKVSPIAIGCWHFGNAEPWMVELDDARKVVSKALDLGVNFFDTANVYSLGRSEEITGELLKDVREDVIIATKVFNPMGEKPNQRGLSRKHIMGQVKGSLRRLKTDYIDLYQTHRWDYETSIDETLSTLNDLVRGGLVRYIGGSSMWAWQFSKALYASEIKGYEKFTSMQDKWNLLYREEEREMVPLCKDQKIGIIPYNPTAVGLLSGRYMKGGRIEIGRNDMTRLQPDSKLAGLVYKPYVEPPENSEIVRRVTEVAQDNGVKPVQIALAWLFKKGATAPIIGTSKPEHVQEAVESIEVGLSEKDIAYMEEPYLPKPIAGHK